jgi:hypothetical protein
MQQKIMLVDQPGCSQNLIAIEVDVLLVCLYNYQACCSLRVAD